MDLLQGQAVMDLLGKDSNCRAESLRLEGQGVHLGKFTCARLNQGVRNNGHLPSKDMSPDSGAGVDDLGFAMIMVLVSGHWRRCMV